MFLFQHSTDYVWNSRFAPFLSLRLFRSVSLSSFQSLYKFQPQEYYIRKIIYAIFWKEVEH